MSSQLTGRRVMALLPVAIALLCIIAAVLPAAAQDEDNDRPAPKWELYGGYSFFHAGADIHGQLPGALFPLSSRLEVNPRGIGLAATYNFNRWFGLTLDTSTHWGSGERTTFSRIDDTAFSNLSFGPKFTFRRRHFAPFLEALVGDHRLMPDAFHDVDKLGVMAGGGLDWNLSRHFALRLIRADYVYSNYRYGFASSTPRTEIRGARLQAGIDFMFGGDDKVRPSPSAACAAQPGEVFAGERVTATASGSNFNPNHTLTYHWNGVGMKPMGSEASTQIDTTGLQPGPYEATANISDGEHAAASCTARFAVKSPQPPTVACAADPASVRMGESSNITANGGSPDGRRLAYTYSTTGGAIAGTDSSARLNTTGAEPGPITVTCNVSDDRNAPLTASSTTIVNVEAPPPPAPEIAVLEAKLALHSIYFQTARPTAEHPERGLVDSQAAILRALASDYKNYLNYKPEAHLILSGHADSRGSAEYNKQLTGRRVERTKSFLIGEGIREENIEIRSLGDEQQLTSEQVKEQIAQNPEVTQAERQQMLGNLPVMVLANNRRVDVSLSTTGQQSTHRYPFNAKDYLALISTSGEHKKAPARRRAKK
ncbi:MAG: OmpA family protein [Acidobacteriota bacterium]|nr:OmpA family protein [Acidobacteriota bacterium]